MVSYQRCWYESAITLGYTFCRVPKTMFIGTIAHTKSRSSVWRISKRDDFQKAGPVLLDVFVRRILEVVSLSVARIGFLCIWKPLITGSNCDSLPHDSIHIQKWLDRKLTCLSILLSLWKLIANDHVNVCLSLFMISMAITYTLNFIIFIVYVYYKITCLCLCPKSPKYMQQTLNTCLKKWSPSCITPGVHIQAIGIHCISITLQCAGQITESKGELMASPEGKNQRKKTGESWTP